MHSLVQWQLRQAPLSCLVLAASKIRHSDAFSWLVATALCISQSRTLDWRIITASQAIIAMRIVVLQCQLAAQAMAMSVSTWV